MKKCTLRCPQCTQVFQSRVRRNWILRNLLFFIPVKIYFCSICDKNVYLILLDKMPEKETLHFKPLL